MQLDLQTMRMENVSLRRQAGLPETTLLSQQVKDVDMTVTVPPEQPWTESSQGRPGPLKQDPKLYAQALGDTEQTQPVGAGPLGTEREHVVEDEERDFEETMKRSPAQPRRPSSASPQVLKTAPPSSGHEGPRALGQGQCHQFRGKS